MDNAEILYTSLLPARLEEGQKTFADEIESLMEQAHHADIAVGYASRASLQELDSWADKHNVAKIRLILGMYYIEGMPESTYHAAVALNKKWHDSDAGEIRLVKAFKYHGKVYVFYREDGTPFAAVTGSANLGAIKLEASNRRQYEIALSAKESSICRQFATHIKDLSSDRCSARISEIDDLTLIREANTSLVNTDYVSRVPQTDVELYSRDKTDLTFVMPIKVPAFAERFMDDGKHFTKSNLNVSYAAPRSARKSRDWFETQFTVAKEFTALPGYPVKNKPFFVITDDGYKFKAHTTSDGNKQFSAVGDELILGRWIKGRLAAAGLVEPVNDTQQDKERKGMITKEMLAAYGCECLRLTKTDRQACDGDELLDVWLISFEATAE